MSACTIQPHHVQDVQHTEYVGYSKYAWTEYSVIHGSSTIQSSRHTHACVSSLASRASLK